MKRIVLLFILLLGGVAMAESNTDSTVHLIYNLVQGKTQSGTSPIGINSAQSSKTVISELNKLVGLPLNTSSRILAIQTIDNNTLVYILTGKTLYFDSELGKPVISSSGVLNSGYFWNVYAPSSSASQPSIESGVSCTSTADATGSSLICTTGGRVTFQVICTVGAGYSVTCDSNTY